MSAPRRFDRKYSLLGVAAGIAPVMLAMTSIAWSSDEAHGMGTENKEKERKKVVLNKPGGKPSIMVVGSVNADIVIECSHLPKRGETVSARKIDTGNVLPGGKGANQAVAAERVSPDGAHCVQFVGVFGNDGNANFLREAMRAFGVGLKYALKASVPSGQAFIFLEEGGENSIIIVGGANMTWPSSLAPETKSAIGAASVVMLQREIPDAINVAVAKHASANGVCVIADVGGMDSAFPKELLRHTTFVCPNETELARMTGLDAVTRAQVIIAAKKLQDEGARNVLVTRGTDGCLLLMQDGEVIEGPSYSAPRVLDTTGAGDSFRAAFAVELSRGSSYEECLQFAAGTASMCVSRFGAMPSMPERQEVIAFLKTAQPIS